MNIDDNCQIPLSVSTSGLIGELTERTDLRIEQIRKNCSDEKERIRENAENAVKDYAEKERAAAESLIRAGEEKIFNRNTIERKKARLLVIEEFIEKMTVRAAAELRESEGYKDYLLNSLGRALNETGGAGKIKIFLGPGDMEYSGMMGEYVSGRNDSCEPEICVDESIEMGGLRVLDEASGIVINSTLDRALYRKRESIRRGIFRILSDRGL